MGRCYQSWAYIPIGVCMSIRTSRAVSGNRFYDQAYSFDETVSMYPNDTHCVLEEP